MPELGPTRSCFLAVLLHRNEQTQRARFPLLVVLLLFSLLLSSPGLVLGATPQPQIDALVGVCTTNKPSDWATGSSSYTAAGCSSFVSTKVCAGLTGVTCDAAGNVVALYVPSSLHHLDHTFEFEGPCESSFPRGPEFCVTCPTAQPPLGWPRR